MFANQSLPTKQNKTKHRDNLYTFIFIFYDFLRIWGKKILQLSNQRAVKLRTQITTVGIFVSSIEMPRKTVRMSNFRHSKGECT